MIPLSNQDSYPQANKGKIGYYVNYELRFDDLSSFFVSQSPGGGERFVVSCRSVKVYSTPTHLVQNDFPVLSLKSAFVGFISSEIQDFRYWVGVG